MTEHRIETRDRAADARKHPIEINPERARGGRRGLPVLYVLISGTVLVVIAFLIIYFVIQPRGIFAERAAISGSSAMYRDASL
jgi:hypothetical protein